MTAYDDLQHARQRLVREIGELISQHRNPIDEVVRAIEALIDAKMRLDRQGIPKP